MKKLVCTFVIFMGLFFSGLCSAATLGDVLGNITNGAINPIVTFIQLICGLVGIICCVLFLAGLMKKANPQTASQVEAKTLLIYFIVAALGLGVGSTILMTSDTVWGEGQGSREKITLD